MSALRRLRRLAMLPVLVWLAVQFAMAGAIAAPDEAAALRAAFPGEEIILCTPDGPMALDHGGGDAGHESCQWCQGFAQAVMPVTPDAWSRSAPWRPAAHGVSRHLRPAARTGRGHHHSRAPPLPIRS